MKPANNATTGVLENSVTCEPLPEHGRVERVNFRIAR